RDDWTNGFLRLTAGSPFLRNGVRNTKAPSHYDCGWIVDLYDTFTYGLAADILLGVPQKMKVRYWLNTLSLRSSEASCYKTSHRRSFVHDREYLLFFLT